LRPSGLLDSHGARNGVSATWGAAGVAHYLVRAQPKPERISELRDRLDQDAFIKMRPFGKALTHSLRNARIQADGTAVWEEEDYCSPPLAQEREAVLDHYFDDIAVERVKPGEAWNQIATLPHLLPRRTR
jgi:hypothetical protein